MARQLRAEIAGGVYHIINRGNDRQEIFKDSRHYEKFISILEENAERFEIKVYGYVLMSNHFHLLVEITEENLSRFMHAITSGYATYFSKANQSSGPVFQGRYKSIIIDKDNYLLELSRYIHLNPYRAGMEKKIGEYRWSSLTDYVSGKKGNKWLCKKAVLKYFKGSDSAKRELYKKFLKEGLLLEDKTYPVELYCGFIGGAKEFVNEVLKQLDIRKMSTEVSFRRCFERQIDIDDILKKVAKEYGVDEEDILAGTVAGRVQAIYLCKKMTSMANREIGKLFGITYSAVSKAFTR